MRRSSRVAEGMSRGPGKQHGTRTVRRAEQAPPTAAPTAGRKVREAWRSPAVRRRVAAGSCAAVGLAWAVAGSALSGVVTGERDWIGMALHGFGVVAILCGLLVWLRSPLPSTGRLLILCGAAFHIGDLRASHHPTLFAIGFCFAYLWTAVLGHLVLALPDGRVSGRVARVLAVISYCSAVGTQVCRYIAESPRPPWWWDMTPGPNSVWAKTGSVVYIGLTAAILVVVARRWSSATRIRRRHAAAMWTAAVVAGTGGIATATAAAVGASIRVRVAVLLTSLVVALLVIPLVSLVRLLHLEIARGRAARALLDFEEGKPLDHLHGLQQALAGALGDPTLTVVYPADTTVGTQAPRPAGHPPDGRAVTRVRRRGELLAVIEHDDALTAQRPVAEAAVGLAGLAIENARLYAAQQEQLLELRRSRERISAAAYEERRRIQRDLHDGAQQQLYAVLLLLDVAKHTLNGAGTPEPVRAAATVDRAHLLLGEAIAGLQDLTQGIYPTDLIEDGLAAAVARLADSAPVPLHADVPACRWPRNVELTAYFLVAEALANAYKHADAHRVDVVVRSLGGGIVVEIGDDGRGGARTRPGSGHTGLHDRLAAVGGTMTVISPAGSGTRLTAFLPVEDPCV